MHVFVRVCVHVCSLLSLSPPARPLCWHALQRAPSCHSWHHTGLKNVTIRGRGETKKREIHTEPVAGGASLKPSKPAVSSVGLRYLVFYSSDFIQLHPHAQYFWDKSGLFQRTLHTKRLCKCSAATRKDEFSVRVWNICSFDVWQSFSGCNDMIKIGRKERHRNIHSVNCSINNT